MPGVQQPMVVAPSSDHFDGRRFFNPSGPRLQPFTSVARMLLSLRRTPWPSRIEQPLVTAPARNPTSVVLTFVGHATFLIQTPAGNVLTDPVYAERAGPRGRLGPRRVRRPSIAFDDLPPIATVLLSHNHYDHCDLPTLSALVRRFDPLVITPIGNRRLLRRAGVRRVEELDWWQTAASSLMPVTLTPAHHFSARTPFDRNRALWGGFMLDVAGRRIYFAGDTAYAPFFREIRARLGPPDLSLLPIGAYEPRWFMRAVHMNPAEAVQSHVELESSETIGMHFGTFQLTAEGMDEPVRALEQACAARGIPQARFRVLGFGESVRLK
jgi:L-ascorbate metabolism protein UlaG (beta-lactamase superfamily)